MIFSPHSQILRHRNTLITGLIAMMVVLSGLVAEQNQDRVQLDIRNWTYQKPVLGPDDKLQWAQAPDCMERRDDGNVLRIRVVGPVTDRTLVQHGGAILELDDVVPAGLPIHISFRARSIDGARWLSINRRWGGSRPWDSVELNEDWREFSIVRSSSRFSTRRLAFNLKEAQRPRLSPHAPGVFEISDLRIECPVRRGGQVPMQRGTSIETGTFPVSIPYELQKPGQVSLGIYDGRGRLVRTLQTGVQQEAGRHTVQWDGLDQHGRHAQPGTYHWRLLRTPGFRAEYLLTLGINPDSQPWHLWPGTHSGPYAVAVDHEGALYIASGVTEHTPFLIKQTLDGQRRLWENFGRGHGYGYLGLASAIAMGTSGQRVLTLDRHGRVTVWQKGASRGGRIKTFDVVTPSNSPRMRERMRQEMNETQGADDAVNGKAETDNTRPPTQRDWRDKADMAVGNGWFGISLRDQNLVRFVDINSDDILRREPKRNKPFYGGRLRDVRVPRPLGVASAPDHTLFVISRGRILKVSTEEEQPTTVITHDALKHARRLDYIPQRDEFLVTTGQPRPNQVVCLSMDGEVLNTYGREGGRRWGEYKPEDFYRIRDICADGRGGFLVTEEGKRTLRRTAHLNQDGKLVNEWYGAPPWGTYDALDPADPSRAMVQLGHGFIAWAKIDYSARDWTVTATWKQPETDGMFPGFGGGVVWKLRRREGNLFLVNTGGDGHYTAPAIYRIRPDDLRPVPFAAAGVLPRKNFPGGAPQWWKQAFQQLPDDAKDHPNNCRAFSWSDNDQDGEIEANEITLGPPVGYGPRRRHLYLDPDWNILYARNGKKSLWGQLSNEASDEAAPVWNWAKAHTVKSEYPSAYAESVQDFSASGVWRDGNGGMYQLLYGNRARPFRHGQYWPASTIGTARFIKWNPKGKLEWEVGNHGTTIHLPPGRFQCPRRILGGAHDCVVAQDRTIRLAMVWSQDGLYAGSFRDGRVDDALPDFVYEMSRIYHIPGLILGDNTDNTMFTTPDGDVIWGPAGCAGSPLYRMHGWDGWSRQVGEIELTTTPRAARREGNGLKARYYGKTMQPGMSLKEESEDEAPELDLLNTGEGTDEKDIFDAHPILKRTDAPIRFGSRTFPPGNHIKRPRPWPAGSNDDVERMFNVGRFAARWTGWLEPLFTEPYQFIIEHQKGDGVKLWIDGELVIETAMDQSKNPGRLSTSVQKSPKIDLEAGQPVPIRLEYRASGPAPHIHLKWESFFTQEQRYVPSDCLYSRKPERN